MCIVFVIITYVYFTSARFIKFNINFHVNYKQFNIKIHSYSNGEMFQRFPHESLTSAKEVIAAMAWKRDSVYSIEQRLLPTILSFHLQKVQFETMTLCIYSTRDEGKRSKRGHIWEDKGNSFSKFRIFMPYLIDFNTLNKLGP